MRTRVFPLVAFIASSITLVSLVLVLGIRIETIPMRASIASQLFTPLLWIGCVGGFACATTVAVKTAWSFYKFVELK